MRLDPEYSAAWKALGRALTAAGRDAEALAAYERGTKVAERRGDQQAAKEMRVFSKRLQRAAAQSARRTEQRLERARSVMAVTVVLVGLLTRRGGGRLSALIHVLMPK